MKKSIGGLPESLILECLARLHYKDIPAASRVCRKWHHLIATPHFYSLRKQLGSTNHVACLLQPMDNDDHSFAVNMFDPVNREWDRLPWIPNSTVGLHRSTKLVSCDFKLVGLSLCDPGSLEPVTSVLVWDFATHRCWKGKDMPSRRVGYHPVTADCRVFVVGGQGRAPDGRLLFDTVWAYDVRKDEWTELPPMSQKRRTCTPMVIEEELWVISGCLTKSLPMSDHSADVYHLQTGKWRRVKLGWPLGLDDPCPSCLQSMKKTRKLIKLKSELSEDNKIIGMDELQLGAQSLLMAATHYWPVMLKHCRIMLIFLIVFVRTAV